TNDAWVVHVDSSGNFINQRVLGSGEHELLKELVPLTDGTVLAFGEYSSNLASPGSPGFPKESEGVEDIFMARLGPQTVGIEAVDGDTSWKIYPNPATDRLLLQFPSTVMFKLTVHNGAGARLLSKTVTANETIDCSHWTKGSYIITITDGQGQSGSKQVVVK
ncbi:MAG: T9SS type A sorting domain-containing protein, partial [Sphingobacteriales bacterium]